MLPSSTGRLLGFSLLVIQPSSDLPSNSSTQPAFFSASVSSLSAAEDERPEHRIAPNAAARMVKNLDFWGTNVTS